MTRKKYNRIRRKYPQFQLATYSSQRSLHPNIVQMSVKQLIAFMFAERLSRE